MAEDFYPIAPTDVGAEVNTIRQPLRVRATWELSNAHFAFDSSLLLPSMTAELLELVALVRSNPGCPLSLFGHADPTGNDGYNKLLAGRRATAVYALLTRKSDLWEQLYNNPMGLDDWKKNELALRVMTSHLEETSSAPGSAPKFFKKYMDSLGVDADGAAFSLEPKDFLGKGADPGGKAAYQGCGEFNPIMMFSLAEQARFSRPDAKTERDEQNAVNRRVTAFLFDPHLEVTPAKWPCPRASEGVAGCQKRFWSDAFFRRANRPERRTFPSDRDTYACRFYDRLTDGPGRSSGIRFQIMFAVTETAEPPVLAVRGAEEPEQRAPTHEVVKDNAGRKYHVYQVDPISAAPPSMLQLLAADHPQSPILGLDAISLLAGKATPAGMLRGLGLGLPGLPPSGSPPDPGSSLPAIDQPKEFPNPVVPEGEPPEGPGPMDL